MRTQSIDTSPEFERMQIARIRTFSAAKKFMSVCNWTQSITSANFYGSSGLSKDMQERERAIAFIGREYGERFAHLFCNNLEKQPEWQLQTPDIQQAMLPILVIAEQVDVPALLIGSVAGSIYGFPRSVQDVDILVDFHSKHLAFLLEQLANHYIFDPYDVIDALQRRTFFSLVHVTRLIKIDVILPATVYEKIVVERRQVQSLIEGRRPLFIASPEDTILLHLIHYQAQGNSADDQWNDILGMLKIQESVLDIAYLIRKAEKMNVEKLLSQSFKDTGIYDDESTFTQENTSDLSQDFVLEEEN